MKRETIRKRIRENPAYLKAGILLAVSAVCFIGVYIWDNSRRIETNSQGEKILERPEEGEDRTHGMHVKIGDREEDITVSVSGRQYNDEERRQAFKEAEQKIGTLILGENESLDEVRCDLDLITEIPDTGISVSWQADRYDVIDVQGHLQEEKLTEEGTVVKLTAVFGYAGEKASCEFYIKVFPPLRSNDEKLMEDLEDSVIRSDEQTKTENYMVLPDSVDGEKFIGITERIREQRRFLFSEQGQHLCLLYPTARGRKRRRRNQPDR